jgi:molybdopterin molybdotransferase
MGNQRVLGLPGNPVSAIVCARIFLVPMLRRLLGLAAESRTKEAVLGEALEANGPREHYMRAVSDWTETGERVVHPLASQDSSLVAELSRADCLIVRPVDAPAAPKGSRVQILPLDD